MLMRYSLHQVTTSVHDVQKLIRFYKSFRCSDLFGSFQERVSSALGFPNSTVGLWGERRTTLLSSSGTPARTRHPGHPRTTIANPHEDTALPRRQAIYLLSFDTRASTTDWLRTEQRRGLRAT